MHSNTGVVYTNGMRYLIVSGFGWTMGEISRPRNVTITGASTGRSAFLRLSTLTRKYAGIIRAYSDRARNSFSTGTATSQLYQSLIWTESCAKGSALSKQASGITLGSAHVCHSLSNIGRNASKVKRGDSRVSQPST